MQKKQSNLEGGRSIDIWVKGGQSKACCCCTPQEHLLSIDSKMVTLSSVQLLTLKANSGIPTELREAHQVLRHRQSHSLYRVKSIKRACLHPWVKFGLVVVQRRSDVPSLNVSPMVLRLAVIRLVLSHRHHQQVGCRAPDGEARGVQPLACHPDYFRLRVIQQGSLSALVWTVLYRNHPL